MSNEHEIASEMSKALRVIAESLERGESHRLVQEIVLKAIVTMLPPNEFADSLEKIISGADYDIEPTAQQKIDIDKALKKWIQDARRTE